MPKGGASSLTPVYAGLQEDLDAFLKSFLQIRSRRFSDYKTLFCHLGMPQLFNGRSNSAEIIEFNEYILVYCLPYMEEFKCLGTPRSLEERLFGLYSLYTFFYLQETNHVVKVRMDPDALRNFGRLEQLVMAEKDYDAYMICLKLREDKAFKLVAFIPIYDPSCFKRFYTDNSVTGVSVQTNVNDPLSKVREMVEGTMFTRLSVVNEEYERLKKAVGFKGAVLHDPQVTMRALLRKREEELEEKSGVNLLTNSDHSAAQLGSHGMIRKEIKEKAHAANLKLARFRRHRTTDPIQVAAESFEFSNSAPKKEEPEEELEHSGPVTRGMARKGQTGRKKAALKKKKRARKAKNVVESPEDVKEEPIAKRTRIAKKEKKEEPPSSPEPFQTFEVSDDEDDFIPIAPEVATDAPKPDIAKEALTEQEMTAEKLLQEIAELQKKQEELQKLLKPIQQNRIHELVEDDEDDTYSTTKSAEFAESLQNLLDPDTQDIEEIEAMSSDDTVNMHENSLSSESTTSTPKSIMKMEKSPPNKRVSFAEKESGELVTTVHEIPARKIATITKENSDADDEYEADAALAERAISNDPFLEKLLAIQKKVAAGRKSNSSESPEKCSHVEHDEESSAAKEEREWRATAEMEPEEPASDAVMYADDDYGFAPLENEAELRAAEVADGYDIELDSGSESEPELCIDE